MIGRPGNACLLYGPALIDFIDTGDRDRATDAALDHLDACDACRSGLEDVALAIASARRIRAEIQTVQPRADAWSRLHARVTSPDPAPWRRPLSLASSVASILLVAVIVSPVAVPSPVDSELVPMDRRQAMAWTALPEWRLEMAYISAGRQGVLPSPPAGYPAERQSGSLGRRPGALETRNHPDRVPPKSKEVESTKPNGGDVLAAI
jgi:hypothetical protein